MKSGIDGQGAATLRVAGERRIVRRIAVGVEAGRVERRVGQSEREALVQLGGAGRPAELDVVCACRVRTSALTPKLVSVRSCDTLAGWSANGSGLGEYVSWSRRTNPFAVNSVFVPKTCE